jgi:hypothetical protein
MGYYDVRLVHVANVRRNKGRDQKKKMGAEDQNTPE